MAKVSNGENSARRLAERVTARAIGSVQGKAQAGRSIDAIIFVEAEGSNWESVDVRAKIGVEVADTNAVARARTGFASCFDGEAGVHVVSVLIRTVVAVESRLTLIRGAILGLSGVSGADSRVA